MSYHLRLYNGAGAFLSFLPEFAKLTVQDALNEDGGAAFDYPKQGTGASQLLGQNDATIALVENGTERARWLLEDDAEERDEDSPYAITGRGLLVLTERALVYPENGVGTLPNSATFTAQTPGAIIRTLLQRAQTRGCIPTVTVGSFSNTLDSSGVAWPKLLTRTYDAGTSLRAVIRELCDLGYIDVRMVGTSLEAYIGGTTLARDNTGLTFLRARDYEAGTAPRQRSRRDVGTVVLVTGDEGKTVERTDAGAVATYGRREVPATQSGTKDAGTLNVVGDAVLALRNHPKQGRGFGIIVAPGVTPWANFRPGDYCRFDTTSNVAAESLRIRGFAVDVDESGITRCELETADLFLEADVAQQRRLDALLGGSVVEAPNSATPGLDVLAPAAPATASSVSTAYAQPDGTTLAQVTISWSAVTTNSDATAIDDLDGYLVSHRVNGGNWTGDEFTGGTASYVSGLPGGANFEARVRARDRVGNVSAYTLAAGIVLAADSTPPPVPTAPVLTNDLGIVRAAWDGFGVGPVAMPADFDHLRVHASTVSGFAVSDANLRDTLPSAGISPITGDAYDTDLYVKFVAVDASGNASAASAQAGPIRPLRAFTDDLVNHIVTSEKLTASAATFSALLNGNFEDQDAAGFAAGWEVSTGAPVVTNGAAVITGTKSMRSGSVNPGGSSRVRTKTDNLVPASPGETWYFAVQAKADVATTRGLYFEAYWCDANGAAFASTNIVGNAALGTGAAIYEGQATAPAGTRSIRVEIMHDNPNVASEATWDDVLAIKVTRTAMIGLLAVGTAQIANLAATNAKIADLDVGKLTAGSLIADITLSARIKTANTGARVELNSTGLRAYDAGGAEVVAIRTDGTASFKGSIESGSTITGATFYTSTGYPRIEIGPGLTVGGLPAIFWKATGAADIVGRIFAEDSDTFGKVLHGDNGDSTGYFFLSETVSVIGLDAQTLELRIGAHTPIYTDPAATNEYSVHHSGTITRSGAVVLAVGTVGGVGSCVEVTHGLGYTPSAVQVQPEAPFSGSNTFGQAIVGSIGATTFRVRCLQPNGTAIADGTNVTLRWVAHK